MTDTSMIIKTILLQAVKCLNVVRWEVHAYTLVYQLFYQKHIWHCLQFYVDTLRVRVFFRAMFRQ